MDRNLLLSFTFFLMMWHQTTQMQTLYVLNNRRRLRRWGVRPVNRSKDEHGFQHNLFEELWTSDAREFYEATARSTIARHKRTVSGFLCQE